MSNDYSSVHLSLRVGRRNGRQEILSAWMAYEGSFPEDVEDVVSESRLMERGPRQGIFWRQQSVIGVRAQDRSWDTKSEVSETRIFSSKSKVKAPFSLVARLIERLLVQ